MEVLLAEDDRALRFLYGVWLRAEGYDVVEAEDGRAALDAIDLHVPDAAVLDVAMPFVDGLDVCRRLRSLDRHVPIVVQTALDDLARDAAAAGADLVLPKPATHVDLLRPLADLVERAHRSERSGPSPP